MSAIRQLQSEIRELQRWKDEMLLVESQWDSQNVGMLLDMELGQRIHPNIEPKIIKMIEKIENLRDGLKEIYNLAQFDWDTMPEQGRKDFRRLVSEIADEALKN